MMKKMNLAHCAAFAMLLPYMPIHAQVTQPAAPVKLGTFSTKPIPLNHIYWHFFLYQEHLDVTAADHEKHGKDGSWLRDHFEKALGFSSSDFAIVRVTSHYVAQEMARLDHQASAIIATDRAAIRANPLPAGATPPGIPMLNAITQERETLLKTQIERMNLALGPVKAHTLEAYLQQTVQISGIAPATPSPEVHK